jgi:hypothetical protein
MVAQPDIMQPLKDYDTADLDVFFGLPVFDNSWSTIFSVEEYFAAFEYASGEPPPRSMAPQSVTPTSKIFSVEDYPAAFE